MKLLISGSRDIVLSVEELDTIINNIYNVDNITEIVSGCAKGIDNTGIEWALKNKIPIKKFIPDWSVGIAAGHIRNRLMGDYTDEAIVIHNGSNGSNGMIKYLDKIKKKCVIIKF